MSIHPSSYSDYGKPLWLEKNSRHFQPRITPPISLIYIRFRRWEHLVQNTESRLSREWIICEFQRNSFPKLFRRPRRTSKADHVDEKRQYNEQSAAIHSIIGISARYLVEFTIKQYQRGGRWEIPMWGEEGQETRCLRSSSPCVL